MKSHAPVLGLGTIALAASLWFLAAVGSGSAADDDQKAKEIREAVLKMAEAIEKNDAAETKKQSAILMKHDLLPIMKNLKLRENGDVTAEEIIERRQLRIRAMTAYVPSVDRDLMGVAGDRTLSIMQEEDLLYPPPEQLSEVDVDWDYAGPLAVAQQMGQVDSFRQLLALAQQAAGLDPSSTAVLALEEGLRAVAEAVAAPAGMLRSRVEVQEIRAREAEEAAAAREAETAAKAGAAFRDMAQGAGALAAADQTQQAGQGRMAA
jgi:hypothetical protein